MLTNYIVLLNRKNMWYHVGKSPTFSAEVHGKLGDVSDAKRTPKRSQSA